MARNESTPISTERRSLLEWLGAATVLGLASPLVQACGGGGGDDTAHLDAADGGPDGRGDARIPDDAADGESADGANADASPDALADTGADPSEVDGLPEVSGDPTSLDPAACQGELPPTASSPSSHPIFDGWNVRTVDEQSLADLLANWRLRVDGLVASPRTFTFCELLTLGVVRQVTDFHCVEGWSVYDVPWDGVPLQALLDAVQPLPEATHLAIGCRGDVYAESLPLAVAREPRTLLGLGIDGHTLPLTHGFPARLVVPRLLGYKNPKYVLTLTLTDTELVGFWPKYGYPVSGEVPAERLRPGKY